MFKNLDIKTIFILILGVALVLMFIFSPSRGEIDAYEDEFNSLKLQNEKLIGDNDSLKGANHDLAMEIQTILIDIQNTEIELVKTEHKLNDLEYERSKVSNSVSNLNADGVAESLNDYLTTRR